MPTKCSQFSEILSVLWSEFSKNTWRHNIYPARMLKGSSNRHLSSVVSTKITRSGYLGIWVTCKHNESSELGEKLAPVCFKLIDTVHEHHSSAFLLATVATPTRPHAFCEYWRGKDCQQIHTIIHMYNNYHACYCRSMQMQHAGYVLYRALVFE